MASADATGIHAALLAVDRTTIGLETGRVVACGESRGGNAIISGEIIEIEPPKKMVFPWRNETKPEITAEGFSRVTYSLEQQGALVKLAILHEMEKAGSKLLQSVSHGWPLVLASLKSLMETGEPLEATKRWVPC